MKPLVIYHTSCADGFGAAFAAWLKLGDDAEYVPMQYLDSKLNAVEAWEALSAAIPSKANTGREVYILDFSLPKPVMDKLFAVSERVTWLDHHKTAFEMWCGKAPELFFTMHKEADDRKYILLDDCKSGAYLAWEFFHPGTEVPMLIRMIDDRDRWQFKMEGTKELNAALWTAPWNFQQWKELNESDLAPMYKAGKAILRAHEQNVQSVVKNATRKCEIPFDEEGALDCVEPRLEWNNGGYWMVHGLAANCPPHLQSDVGHELANQSGTFGLLWFIDKDNNCRCSLRSNGDYDVSAIAKAFGGGGHRNAAGFTTSIQTLLEWTK